MLYVWVGDSNCGLMVHLDEWFQRRLVTSRYLMVSWCGYVDHWNLTKWSLARTLEGCQVAALCWFSLVHVRRHGWKGCATCDLQTAHLGMLSCERPTLFLAIVLPPCSVSALSFGSGNLLLSFLGGYGHAAWVDELECLFRVGNHFAFFLGRSIYGRAAIFGLTN